MQNVCRWVMKLWSLPDHSQLSPNFHFFCITVVVSSGKDPMMPWVVAKSLLISLSLRSTWLTTPISLHHRSSAIWPRGGRKCFWVVLYFMSKSNKKLTQFPFIRFRRLGQSQGSQANVWSSFVPTRVTRTVVTITNTGGIQIVSQQMELVRLLY